MSDLREKIAEEIADGLWEGRSADITAARILALLQSEEALARVVLVTLCGVESLEHARSLGFSDDKVARMEEMASKITRAVRKSLGVE